MNENHDSPERQKPAIPDGFDYCALTNDLLFHMVFSQNMKALRSLLSALLGMPESDIQSIDVLNPMQYNASIDTKVTVLDLKLHLNADEFLLIELQVRRFEHWTNRTMVYACRQIDEQSRGSQFQYDSLQPVIQITIMDHTLFPDHKRFYAKYQLRDDEGYRYSDKLSFYVLDLTATSAATAEERTQGLVEWAHAFTAQNWEEVQSIENAGVREATKTMEVIMSKPSERQLLWDRRMAQLDYESQMSSARKQGLAEGRAEGRAETIEEIVKNLMNSLGLTKEQAMTALKLSSDDRKILSDRL